MNRDRVIRILSGQSIELAGTFRVESLAPFGSESRDEAGPGSDVDLLVEFRGKCITMKGKSLAHYLITSQIGKSGMRIIRGNSHSRIALSIVG